MNIINVLSLLGGLLCGFSIGLGFFPYPRFSAKKNLIVQLIIGFIGLAVLVLDFYLLGIIG